MSTVTVPPERLDALMERLDLATWWAKVAAISATSLLLIQLLPALFALFAGFAP